MAVSSETISLAGDDARRTIDWRNVWSWAVFLVVLGMVIVPLVALILGSFSTEKLPNEFSWDEIGLENYVKVWTARSTYVVFYNTVVYVGVATVFGIGMAAIIAWLVERTNMPGKVWIYAGVPMSLAMPGLLQAMAWVLLLSPRAGWINRWFMDTFGLETAPFSVYTLIGMAFVEGLRLVPTAFLMLVPLLRSMDPALEEAAAVSGASPRSTVRKITLGLMVPGLVAVTIFQAMTALEVFEVPGVLGMPVGIHVFATKIFLAIQAIELVPSYGEANALGILYLMIGLIFAYLYWKVIRRSERYTVITGKGYRPRHIELGRWKYGALALVIAYLFLAVGLPFLVLLWTSLVPFIQPPSWEGLQNLTLKHYEYVFTFPRFAQTFWNTIQMVVAAATATTALSFFVSMVVVRSQFWGRRVLDILAFIPHTIPGIVLALAFVWVFLVLHWFGSIWTVAFAFTVGFMAYGTRAMNSAILQIHKDLEEAAGVAGASPFRVMRKIFLPLMAPTFIGLWIWVVLLAIRIAGVPLLLAEGPRNQVLATLIWKMWDEGSVEPVGAIGTLLIVGIFGLVLILRWLGFGGRLIQTR